MTQEHLPPDPSAPCISCVAPVSVAATPSDPSAYLGEWIALDGSSVEIRPICPDDEPKMVRFHQSLSNRSVYLRYFHCVSLDARVTHERLARICSVDYDRETALVAESVTGDIVAVGRLSRMPSTPADAEFALLVSDAWHEHGLGTELLRRLILLARPKGIRCVFADILAENDAMLKICRQLGFALHYSVRDRVVKASIALVPIKDVA
jgi:acetyltransferase